MYIDKLNWCKHIDKLNKLGRSLIEWALLPRNIKKTLNSLCPCLKVSAAVREDTPRLQMGLIKCKKETTTFWALGRSTFPKKMKGLPKILRNSSVSNFGPFWARFGPQLENRDPDQNSVLWFLGPWVGQHHPKTSTSYLENSGSS